MSELFSGECEYNDCEAKWGEARQVTLVSSIHVTLCTPHQRAYDQFVLESNELMMAHSKAMAAADSALTHDHADLDERVDTMLKARKVLAQQAIDWVAEHCPA